MRAPIVGVLFSVLSLTSVQAQIDYIILRGEDSVRHGDVQDYYDEGEGKGVKIKGSNKKWVRHHYSRVQEYAIKGDTFRVFDRLKLMKTGVTVDYVRGRLLCSGAVNLYELYGSEYYRISGIGGPSVTKSSMLGGEIFVVENPTTREVAALVQDVDETLAGFMPAEYVSTYVASKKKFKYRDYQQLVCGYNEEARRR